MANGITQPEKKVAVLLTVIGPKTYGLLRSFLTPNKPAEQSYARLVEVMKNHLNPKPLVIAERFKFHRKCQSESETVAQFLAELRRLAEHCDFGDHLEEALRDRLVCGLRNETTQRRLLAEADLTLIPRHMILHRAWKPREGKQANYGVRRDSRRFSASLHLKLLTVSNRVFAVASQVTALTSATTGLRNACTCGKRPWNLTLGPLFP